MADYCLLEDAYQSSLIEQKPVGKKKKRAVTFPEVLAATPGPASLEEVTVDPDRQQYVRPKLIDAMTKTKPAWFGTTDAVEPSQLKLESFADYNPHVNTGGRPDAGAGPQAPSQALGALAGSNEVNPGPAIADDIMGQEADFRTAFNQRGIQKASAFPASPIADVWKPLGLLGADYVPHMAPPVQEQSSNIDAIQRRVQSIYSRLDALETSQRENAQTEVAMFVLSGVFFIFSLDLITKIATR